MSLTEGDCNHIEFEILGCYLENLDCKQVNELLDAISVYGYRAKWGTTIHSYSDAVTSLFNRTKDRFDWASVKTSDGSRQERPRPWPDPPEDEGIKISELGEACYNIPEDFKGDPLDLRFMFFAEKVNKLILEQKSPTYKDSWRKRGLVGIYHNLCRKWDRIENIFEDEELSGGRELNVDKLPTGDESIVETVADLFAYTGKCMTYFEYEPRYRVMLNQWKVRNNLEDGPQ